jgi:hypothetical protein
MVQVGEKSVSVGRPDSLVSKQSSRKISSRRLNRTTMKKTTIIANGGGICLALLVLLMAMAFAPRSDSPSPGHEESAGKLVLPRSDSAVAMSFLKTIYGPTGFLNRVKAGSGLVPEAGSVSWKCDSATGLLRLVTMYYAQPALYRGAKKIMFQSSFIADKTAGAYADQLAFLWTHAWLPGGDELDCERLSPDRYEENIWYHGDHRKVKEHSVYVWKDGSHGVQEWTIAGREGFDEATGRENSWIKYTNAGHCLWGGETGADGIRREYECDSHNEPVERDFANGSNRPFRIVLYDYVWQTIWLLDAEGNIERSYVFKHALQDHPPPILPIVAQVVCTIWSKGLPVYDQIIDLDMRYSQPSAIPAKLVYVMRGYDAYALCGKDYKCLRVRLDESGKFVRMITVSERRFQDEAIGQAYSSMILPEFEQEKNLTISGFQNRSRIVWVFGDDGRLKYLAQFNGINVLSNLTMIGKSKPPLSRAELDPDLDPSYFLADPPCGPQPPSAIPKNLPEVDAQWLKLCPSYNAQWLKMPDIPEIPIMPEVPPH